ncbi:MAG: type II toxin-antitoxin system HigB family toxin [Acidobacteriota bacterium]|nr:type II toxin-antitoxin system HigB family toxin [Acidobacteriota bacterium]
MKVVGRESLEKFARKHADVRGQIDAWVCEAEEADWQTPDDIKKRYASVSFLANNRVIFNLKGNKYRLDIKISFKNQLILIMRIGTHEEYSTWKF